MTDHRINTLGPPPTVVEVDDQLIVQWADGREESFIMRTSLFEAMIADINGGKRLAAALTSIRSTIDGLG